MTTASMAADNPFVDPIASFEEHGRDHSFAVDSTLAVGRNASLTLGTDSLIVLGESRMGSEPFSSANFLEQMRLSRRETAVIVVDFYLQVLSGPSASPPNYAHRTSQELQIHAQYHFTAFSGQS
jgi:hypothetical protein